MTKKRSEELNKLYEIKIRRLEGRKEVKRDKEIEEIRRNRWIKEKESHHSQWEQKGLGGSRIHH